MDEVKMLSGTSPATTPLGLFLGRSLAERGITQSELAKASGLSQSTVSRYLARQESPNPALLRRMAKALNVDPALLIDLAYPQEETNERISKSGRPVHPLALALDQILAGDSPLSEQERMYIMTIIRAVLAPHRYSLRRP